MAQQSVRGDGLGQVLIQPQYNPNRQHSGLQRNPVWPWMVGAGAAALGGGAWWRTHRATKQCQPDPTLFSGAWLTPQGALNPDLREPLWNLFDDMMGGIYGAAPTDAQTMSDLAIQLASGGLDAKKAEECRPAQAYWGELRKVRAAVRKLASEYLAESRQANPSPNPRGYITLDSAPMRRRRNAGWPLIAGGVVGGAALLGAAAWKCRARVISDDLINLGEDTVYRRIQYKGCFQSLPYEVIVSMADPKRYLDPAGMNYGMEEEFNAFVLLRSSFSSLKEAQRFGSEDDEENDEDRESNPSGEYAACMNACVSREGCNYRAGKAKAACHQQCQSECRGLAVPKPKPGAPAPRPQTSRLRRLAQRRVMRRGR